MNKQISISIAVAALIIGGAFYLSSQKKGAELPLTAGVNQALAAKFEILKQNGNSSCSGTFRESIAAMPDTNRLQGSCCSPMSLHRYAEQVEGLVEFKSVTGQNIDKIPDDPYDIEAGLAKELLSYYDLELTPDEQKAYDYAMLNSSEKGPCCCKCWRWYVYGGLGKYLIKNHGFTGEQLTEVWNLSDGCGGDSEHHH
ncbi:MAG: hypothetical protein COT81_01590 [Candidatus Buchananbacteria bacterium CG10_big_fil_rev_8_21_14_0_10_42_9]|uniref:Uncharacterized protein n=1 Tax=Candidatus Buchananbacteria bacterium CG10_big_fil_rev_8_21_14_0_10_42_9 TaxID=1974526 RepID=A0A2H0W1V1_9BACT|nr:MAG: hypothetical protein COT81_01590 [Candidatus Buchananbacteria bacterium CG10_big_fil_rev_8_21_14_0_10_42_9]